MSIKNGKDVIFGFNVNRKIMFHKKKSQLFN